MSGSGLTVDAATGAASPRILRVTGRRRRRRRPRRRHGSPAGGSVSRRTRCMFDDVNIGSTTSSRPRPRLVVESAETEFGWRILGYDLRPACRGTTPAGTLTFDNPPRPGSLVVVFVGVTASTDVIDSVDRHRRRLHRAPCPTQDRGVVGAGRHLHRRRPARPRRRVVGGHRHPSGRRVGLGRRLRGRRPRRRRPGRRGRLRGARHRRRRLGQRCRRRSPCRPAGDAAAVVLAYLHVAADAGVGVGGGDRRRRRMARGVPVVADRPDAAYFQTMSRAPGQPESTSTTVHWADVQTGTADAYSAVQLAVEMQPGDALSTDRRRVRCLARRGQRPVERHHRLGRRLQP